MFICKIETKVKKITLFLTVSLSILLLLAIFFGGNNEEFIKSSHQYKDSFNSFIIGDGNYYYKLYMSNPSIDGIYELALVNINLLPQLLLLIVVDGSFFSIYLLNFTFLTFAIFSLRRYLKVNQYLFFTIILLNPFLVTNLFSVGKEIPGYISVLFYLSYLLSNKNKYIVLAVILAFFCRIELVALLLLFPIIRRVNFKKTNLFFMLLLISIIFMFKGDVGEFNLYNNPNESSLNLMAYINELNREGLYFLTFFIKIIINLFSPLLVIDVEHARGFIITSTSLLFFILAIFAAINFMKLRMSNDIYLFFIYYCIIFSTPAFVSPRYFIPLLPIFAYLAFINSEFIRGDNKSLK